jgi:hypothetical protein
MFHVLLCKVFSSLWRRESWTEENSKRSSPGGIHQIESTLILQPSRYCQYSRVLFCMHVFAPAQSHCTNKQTNNLSFMPWEEDALGMHNCMHKQTTHHSWPWEEDSPSVWTFTMTCTSRQTTSIAMRSILLRFGSSQSHAQSDKQPALPWEEDSRSGLHNGN